jgi:hypothetical protein
MEQNPREKPFTRKIRYRPMPPGVAGSVAQVGEVVAAGFGTTFTGLVLSG